MNIMLVRGIGEILTYLPFIISFALQLDYYIFTIITWIGVNYFMGLFGGGWLWCKDPTKLKAILEKELTKKKPNEVKIQQIINRITKLESK